MKHNKRGPNIGRRDKERAVKNNIKILICLEFGCPHHGKLPPLPYFRIYLSLPSLVFFKILKPMLQFQSPMMVVDHKEKHGLLYRVSVVSTYECPPATPTHTFNVFFCNVCNTSHYHEHQHGSMSAFDSWGHGKCKQTCKCKYANPILIYFFAIKEIDFKSAIL